MNLLKKKNAITLIALIVTIIVLLILAAVVINFTVGNQGIINKTQTAIGKYENAQEEEEIQISKYIDEINKIDGNREFITKEEYNQLKKDIDELKTYNQEHAKYTIEKGTDYYVKKYDTGEMELYGTYSSRMTTSYQWGSGYYAPIVTVNFPINFTSTPYVVPVLSRNGSSNVFSLSLDNISNTGFAFYPYSMGPTVNNVSYVVNYVAIGNWK